MTSPFVASMGIVTTVPLTLVVDWIVRGRSFGLIGVIGIGAMFVAIVLMIVSEKRN